MELKFHTHLIERDHFLKIALLLRGFVSFWSKSQIQNSKNLKFKHFQMKHLRSQEGLQSGTQSNPDTVVCKNKVSFVGLLHFGLFSVPNLSMCSFLTSNDPVVIILDSEENTDISLLGEQKW